MFLVLYDEYSIFIGNFKGVPRGTYPMLKNES